MVPSTLQPTHGPPQTIGPLLLSPFVHMEHKGKPVSMLLNLVEVVKSHSGKNLAEAFEKVLKDFGISDKASSFFTQR